MSETIQDVRTTAAMREAVLQGKLDRLLAMYKQEAAAVKALRDAASFCNNLILSAKSTPGGVHLELELASQAVHDAICTYDKLHAIVAAASADQLDAEHRWAVRIQQLEARLQLIEAVARGHVVATVVSDCHTKGGDNQPAAPPLRTP